MTPRTIRSSGSLDSLEHILNTDEEEQKKRWSLTRGSGRQCGRRRAGRRAGGKKPSGLLLVLVLSGGPWLVGGWHLHLFSSISLVER